MGFGDSGNKPLFDDRPLEVRHRVFLPRVTDVFVQPRFNPSKAQANKLTTATASATIWTRFSHTFIPRYAFRREAQHDVEARREFANAGTLERDERDGDRLPRLLILDALINTITLVAGLALDVTLRNQLLAAFHLDRVMNVRGASRIRHRLDGAEEILAGRAGEEASEALEIGIAFLAVAAPGMEVGSVVVALPDFDQRIADRPAARRAHARSAR